MSPACLFSGVRFLSGQLSFIYVLSFNKWQMSFNSTISTITDWNHNATSTVLNHSYFLSIPFVRLKFHSVNFFFFWGQLLCGTKSYLDAFLNPTILTSSSKGSVVIYPTYPHNVQFLLCSLIFISHT